MLLQLEHQEHLLALLETRLAQSTFYHKQELEQHLLHLPGPLQLEQVTLFLQQVQLLEHQLLVVHLWMYSIPAAEP